MRAVKSISSGEFIEIMRFEMHKKLFTIIELLIVFALIAILTSLLVPSLKRTLAFATDLQCLTHLKQMGVARSLYSDDNETRFLAWRTRVGPQGPASYSWWSFLLPYLGLESQSKSGTVIEFEILNCSVPRNGLMTNNFDKHQGYGYNTWLDIDRYTGDPPFYCYSRKYSEVVRPSQTIEVGDNYRLSGYINWNGDVRLLLGGGHPSFLNNCADVHQGLT